ncbi:MAG: NHL repeat-containing protein [candidate division KSB1 bacterium]|nr:NHL repeat-containing protein [candidate division KSB1 bacterium]MDZ7310144.1 NHL repeat-containing protein [candidate division KSB1 bacterium]
MKMPGDKYDPTTLVFPAFLHTYGVRKATAKHLYLFVQNRVKVRDPQGIAATRLDVWDDPKETKDDDEITVYGVNSGQDVVIYNTSMNMIAIYGLYEKGERKLNRPRGIAAHRAGDVYLADTGNNRVVHFFNPSKELKWVSALGGMSVPQDVAISADRTVFVTDTGNNRVLVFREDKLIQSWDNPGLLSWPSGIAATDSTEQWSFYKDTFVAVIDRHGQRLQKFTRDGRLIKAVTVTEIGKPNAKLMYVAIDYYSNVYVTDFTNHCVHKFDRDLNYLAAYGRRGNGDKEFIEPRGIAIYKRFGQVLIDDRESAQYYWIGTDIANLRASKHLTSPLLQIDYFLTEPSYVTLEILDARGQTLAKPLNKTLRFSGPQQELFGGNWEPAPVWHAPAGWSDDQRRHVPEVLQKMPPVASGRYLVRITVEATYSSYKYFAKTVETHVEL